MACLGRESYNTIQVLNQGLNIYQVKSKIRDIKNIKDNQIFLKLHCSSKVCSNSGRIGYFYAYRFNFVKGNKMIFNVCDMVSSTNVKNPEKFTLLGKMIIHTRILSLHPIKTVS